MSVDSGYSAGMLASWDNQLLEEWGEGRPWLRIRSLPDPGDPVRDAALHAEVAGLRLLLQLGFRPFPLLRWSASSWNSGTRPGVRMKFPLDLREAYYRGYEYGEAYGAVVVGFEIENEPDINFVLENAETYMAFQKALYLGLKEGASQTAPVISDGQKARSDEGREAVGDQRSEKAKSDGLSSALSCSRTYRLLLTTEQGPAPLVVMPPLALPPGPYFEQLVENGLFSYTDAFNYHYYGYAEDFSGVYGQFADAVRELSDEQEAISDKLHMHQGLSGQAGAMDSELSASREASQGKTVDSGSEADGSEAFNFKLKASRFVNKGLPVLLTEYGYGLLKDPGHHTVDGRERQWRWFKKVGEQILDLKIAGPMAFYLPPYLGVNDQAYGLTVRPEDGASSDKAKASHTGGTNTLNFVPSADRLPMTAGGVTYTAADFGVNEVEPWMKQIGRRFGPNEATPALAWIYDFGKRHPYQSKDWSVDALPPSPMVIDFIAGSGLIALKRYGGYLATGLNRRRHDESRNEKEETEGDERIALKSGSGQLVLYNFSEKTIAGRLRVVRGRGLVENGDQLERKRVLEPMDRLVIPVDFNVPAEVFAKQKLSVCFAASEAGGLRGHGFDRKAGEPSQHVNQGISPAVFATSFWPTNLGMKEALVEDFGRANPRVLSDENVEINEDVEYGISSIGSTAERGPSSQPENASLNAANLTLLDSRPLATEEPRLAHVSGRWRTTPGIEVMETNGEIWQFAVSAFPKEPNRPAMAELPLPDDFEFPDDGMMRMTYRLLHQRTADGGQYFELYFRTANGNLYQVWPRQYATGDWKHYMEMKGNYTMAFYGRANLPWRFRDNRPVSLVFFFRPRQLPVTYEVKNARIVRLAAEK